MKNIWTLCLSVLVLSGCVSREQADEKLARACVAGAEAFLEDGFRIKEVKNKTFGTSHEFGRDYREVRVNVLETDDWLDVDKEYKCVFVENMAPFGLSHSAEIYQLKFDDQVYGKVGNELVGTMHDFTKLGNAVNAVLD